MNCVSFLASHPEKQCCTKSQWGEANLLLLPIYNLCEILDCIDTVFRKVSNSHSDFLLPHFARTMLLVRLIISSEFSRKNCDATLPSSLAFSSELLRILPDFGLNPLLNEHCDASHHIRASAHFYTSQP